MKDLGLARPRHILREGRHLWTGLLVLGAAGAALALWPCARTAQGIGAMLEGCGLLTVVIGLNDRLRAFGLTGLWSACRAYLRRVFLHPKPIVGTISGGGNLPAGSAGLRATKTVGPSPTLEERVRALETNVGNLGRSLADAKRELKVEISETAGELRRQMHATTRDLSALHTLVREVEVGDLGWEVVGIVWLLIGLLLSAAAPVFA